MGNCLINPMKRKAVEREKEQRIENLKKQTNDLPLYKIIGKMECKIVDVYDGDTCTIVIFNKGDFEKHKLRMSGYDSPEMHPHKDVKYRKEKIWAAQQAKERLSELILNKICTFESQGYDKYGRLLGILHVGTANINEQMICEGHGYVYNGGTKKV